MSGGLLVLVGVLVAALLLRMPIGFGMLAAGIGYLLATRQDLGLVAEQVSNGLYNSYVLLAVPLFVFAANLMNAGTVSERIFDFCRILVGRMRGGLAQVDILVSVIFSGMSGSAIADAAGPGLVTIRQMLKKPEYSPGFAGAVVVASATLGPIIPPSIPMVIYAMVSGTSVGALFSSNLTSLSNSTTTHSTRLWVANLILSAASWLDGSAVAITSAWLRLPNTMS